MTGLERLESLGYRVTLGTDGKIRAHLPGGIPPPPEARELLAWCRAHREEVKDALISRLGQVKSSVLVFTFALDHAEMLERWKALQRRDMVHIESVRVYADSGKICVSYIPLVESWAVEAELREEPPSA